MLSPDDSASEVLDKVADWVSAGAQQVWIVDPIRGRVTVYRGLDQVQRLESGDDLDGGDVVPGFRMAVNSLFES